MEEFANYLPTSVRVAVSVGQLLGIMSPPRLLYEPVGLSACRPERKAVAISVRATIPVLKLASGASSSFGFRTYPFVRRFATPLRHTSRGRQLVEDADDAVLELIGKVVGG